MSRASLRAEPRVAGHARADRREGYVPAIVYGKDMEPQPLNLLKSEVERLLQQHSGHGLVDLKVGDTTKTVMVREIQRDPVRGDVLHMDLYRVSMQERIHTTVPIVITGEEELIRSGAVIQPQMREIDIECLPTDIPEHIVADLSGASAGDAVTVASLRVPEGVTVLADPDQIIATISIPRALRTGEGSDDASGVESEADEDHEESE